MNTGTQIRILREYKSISREQMSDWLDMSCNTYKKIEYGEKVPTLDQIKIIAEKLEVDPALFLSKDGSHTITNGDYSPGVFGNGNVVTVDKKFMQSVANSLDALTKLMGKLIEERK